MILSQLQSDRDLVFFCLRHPVLSTSWQFLDLAGMNSIQDWFDSARDYPHGLALYRNHPEVNPRLLKKLEQGRGRGHQALLFNTLRKLKNRRAVLPKMATLKTVATPSSDESLAQEQTQQARKSQGFQTAYGHLRYHELPDPIKKHYREIKDLFYDLCDLKFALNALPPKAVSEALALQGKILRLDAQRQLLWKILDDFKRHGRLPKPKDDDVLRSLSPLGLLQKKNNVQSQISKITKRIDQWYTRLDQESDGHQGLLLEAKITRAEARLLAHQQQLLQINEYLDEHTQKDDPSS